MRCPFQVQNSVSLKTMDGFVCIRTSMVEETHFIPFWRGLSSPWAEGLSHLIKQKKSNTNSIVDIGGWFGRKKD